MLFRCIFVFLAILWLLIRISRFSKWTKVNLSTSFIVLKKSVYAHWRSYQNMRRTVIQCRDVLRQSLCFSFFVASCKNFNQKNSMPNRSAEILEHCLRTDPVLAVCVSDLLSFSAPAVPRAHLKNAPNRLRFSNKHPLTVWFAANFIVFSCIFCSLLCWRLTSQHEQCVLSAQNSDKRMAMNYNFSFSIDILF